MKKHSSNLTKKQERAVDRWALRGGLKKNIEYIKGQRIVSYKIPHLMMEEFRNALANDLYPFMKR